MKTRKKLFGAVAALLVAIIAAASTTFAWFTMNNKVVVGDFTAEITAGSDTLLIAVTAVDGTPNGADFKMKASEDAVASAILASSGAKTVQDLIDALGMDRAKAIDVPAKGASAAYEAAELIAAVQYDTQPTSAEKVKLAVKLDALTPISTQDNATRRIDLKTENGTGAITTTNNFISFDVHFQATEALKIYLNGESKVTGAPVKKTNVTAWGEIARDAYSQTITGQRNYSVPNTEVAKTPAIAAGEALEVNPANAMRVGFVDDTTTPVTNIWNPNFEQGFNKTATVNSVAMGLAESWRYYTSGATGASTAVAEQLAGVPGLYTANLDKVGGLTVLTTGSATANAGNGFVEGKNSTILTTLTVDGATKKSTGKLTVTIWLEGTDGDCFNAILASAVTTKLSFLGAK